MTAPYPGGQPYPGQGYPGNQPYPGQPYPGQGYPGGQPNPGQGYPGGQRDPSQPGFASVNLPGQSPSNVVRQRGMRMVTTGLILMVVGIAITVISYNLASNGGTYLVTVLPLSGLIRVIYGLRAIARAGRLPR
jgi:hypothetical protein